MSAQASLLHSAAPQTSSRLPLVMSDDRGIQSDLKNHLKKYAKKQYKKVKQQYNHQSVQPQHSSPAPSPHPTQYSPHQSAHLSSSIPHTNQSSHSSSPSPYPNQYPSNQPPYPAYPTPPPHPALHKPPSHVPSEQSPHSSSPSLTPYPNQYTPHQPQYPAYHAPPPHPISNKPPSHAPFEHASPSHPPAATPPSAAPPLPPGAYMPAPVAPVPTIIPRETLQLIPTRPTSARVVFGAKAVMESRKGLSRVLNAASHQDIHHFAYQLKSSDVSAVETNWETEDKIPVFAISYVQKNPAQGRFKFDDDQWNCFLQVVQQFPAMGISQFRIWLDQCLWLRDASQGSWAHTGLLPYVLWPVVCLGKKEARGDRSVASRTRIWPFLEQVSGLWGMGLIFGRELRGKTEESGWRRCVSYQHRALLEPEIVMTVLLFNIFHGATDLLQTGGKEDVEELNDMARMNVLQGGEGLYVGSDWRQRIASVRKKSSFGEDGGMKPLTLQVENRYDDSENVYLEGSRTVMSGGWNMGRGWLSGHKYDDVDEYTFRASSVYQVMTDGGEFAILGIGSDSESLRLLVAMDGMTSNFVRGKVAWTKVMAGLGSCLLSKAGNKEQIEESLRMELGRKTEVLWVKDHDYYTFRHEVAWE